MTETKDLVKEIKEDKKFKNMTLTTGNDPSLIIRKIPFDIIMLDELLKGGMPIGKFSLIYGSSHVGKTFLCMKLISMAQKLGWSIVFIDVDKGYEPDWWSVVGVDIDNLFVAQPDYGEQAMDLAISLVKKNTQLVIIDSLDLLVPVAETDVSMEESFIATRARLISKSLREIKRINRETVLIGTNHISESIGGGRFSQFSIPGGKAQEDFSSVMMWVARAGKITENEVVQGGDDKKRVGFKMRVTLEKDKVGGRTYDNCEIPFLYEGGAIDTVGGLIEICLEEGVILKDRAKYELLGQTIIGKLKVKEYLTNNLEAQEELRRQLKDGRN